MAGHGKIILIGQAPSRRSDPRRPLEGDPLAARLAQLFGWDRQTYLRCTRRFNLLQEYPGKNGKGDAWRAAAGEASVRLLRRRLRGRRILLLGELVARAFRVDRFPRLEWFVHPDYSTPTWFALLPHPSGVSRWWNDPANRDRAGRFLAKAAAGVWD